MNPIDPLSPDAVHGFLDRVEEAAPDRAAVRAGSSFEDLARRWADLGLRPGDLVLLALPNGIELLAQFFGVLAAGGVPAPVAPNTPSGRLRELVDVMGARGLVTVHLPRGLSGLERREPVGHARAGLFVARKSPAARPGEVVLLTSGTSGFASGCVFGLPALILNATRHADAIGMRAEDVILVNLPLHFSFALVAQALAALVRGSRLVVSGPPFHPPSYLRTIADHEVTVSSLTPLLARRVLRGDGQPCSCLRVLTVGGDSLAEEHVKRLLDRRPDGELFITYGLTQAGPRVSTLAAHREPAHRYASVGRPLDGTRVWLDDTAKDSAARQLLVASDTVMRRRIGLVEGHPQNDLREPGVLATGDLFEQDADGYLFFRGRLCDFVVRRGEKICLAAVRRVASQLPQVCRARTRVLQRKEGDSEIVLALTIAKGAQGRADEFRTRLITLLRRSEMPDSIEFVGSDGGHHDYK